MRWRKSYRLAFYHIYNLSLLQTFWPCNLLSADQFAREYAYCHSRERKSSYSHLLRIFAATVGVLPAPRIYSQSRLTCVSYYNDIRQACVAASILCLVRRSIHLCHWQFKYRQCFSQERPSPLFIFNTSFSAPEEWQESALKLLFGNG